MTDSSPDVRPIAKRVSADTWVQMLDDFGESHWDAYTQTHPDATVFHTLQWRDVIRTAFGHEPIYLVARRGEAVSGVLPLFFVNSLLAGRMLVSVPYSVGGGVLADDRAAASALRDHAVQLATWRRCNSIDLRSERASFPDLPVSDRYIGFTRELPPRVQDVLEWIPRKARAAARNGKDKYHLSSEFRNTNLKSVWTLYTQNMRRLASISYPFRFFTAIRRHMRGTHWVQVVKGNGRPVASLVTLLHKNRVMPYLVGFAEGARACSAANFLYFALMEHAVSKGYRIFDFGRSRLDNAGSCDFKRFHGFEPTPLEYQRIPVCGRPRMDLSPSNRKLSLVRGVWPYLPLPITQMLGGYLSFHIPG